MGMSQNIEIPNLWYLGLNFYFWESPSFSIHSWYIDLPSHLMKSPISNTNAMRSQSNGSAAFTRPERSPSRLLGKGRGPNIGNMGKRLNQGCPAHLPMLKNILGYLGKKMLKKAITFWSLSWEHRCDGVSRNPITIPWVWYEVINLHNFPHGCLCDCHPRIPRKCDGVSGNPIKFFKLHYICGFDWDFDGIDWDRLAPANFWVGNVTGFLETPSQNLAYLRPAPAKSNSQHVIGYHYIDLWYFLGPRLTPILAEWAKPSIPFRNIWSYFCRTDPGKFSLILGWRYFHKQQTSKSCSCFSSSNCAIFCRARHQPPNHANSHHSVTHQGLPTITNKSGKY